MTLTNTQKLLIGIVVFLALAAVGIGLFFGLSKKKEDDNNKSGGSGGGSGSGSGSGGGSGGGSPPRVYYACMGDGTCQQASYGVYTSKEECETDDIVTKCSLQNIIDELEDNFNTPWMG